MNYFFVTLSQLYGNPEKLNEYIYNIDNSDKTYTGKLANDAPLKYVQDKLAMNKEIVDKYIIIATPECKSKIPDTNISTTDYYKQEISENMSHLCKQYEYLNNIIVGKGFNSLEDYLNDSVVIIDNNTELNSKIFALFDEYEEENKRILMDISGGSRELPMQLSLILYHLGYKNSAVEDLIYASKSNTDNGFVTKINSFTDSWKMIVSSIEDENVKKSYEAKTKYEEAITGKKKSKEYHDAIKQLDNTSDSLGKVFTNKAKQESLKNAEAKANELKKSNNEEVQKLAKMIDKEVKQTKSVDPLDILINKKDEILINEFYEKISDVFEDKGVITNKNKKKDKKNNDKMHDVFRAINRYYFNAFDDGALKNCVCKVVKDMCDKILSINITPRKYYHQILDINNSYKYSKNVVKKFGRFNSQGVNYELAQLLLKKIESYEIDLDNDCGTNLVRDYLDVQYLYYNYGFPFACRYNDNVYPEVQEYYLGKFEELVNKLEEVRVANKEEYNNLLKKYSENPKTAIEKMPEELQGIVNRDKIKDPEFAAEFMGRLDSQRTKVAVYRNKLAHDKENTKKNELKLIANEIREWLIEYKQQLK